MERGLLLAGYGLLLLAALLAAGVALAAAWR